jgi:hypothetical protein
MITTGTIFPTARHRRETCGPDIAQCAAAQFVPPALT